jgi:hypothetical protein
MRVRGGLRLRLRPDRQVAINRAINAFPHTLAFNDEIRFFKFTISGHSAKITLKSFGALSAFQSQ